MKPALREILGRTIEAVVVSEDNLAGPRDQVFLVFSDGTCYELYGDVNGSGDLTSADREWAVQYARKFQGRVTVFDGVRTGVVTSMAPSLRDDAADVPNRRLDNAESTVPDDELGAWVGAGTVLVVDDNSTVRELYRRVLRRRGFSVVDAPDGFSGFNVFRECCDRLVAVVMDLDMPRMNGVQAAAMMRRSDPDVPIVMIDPTDGWPDDTDDLPAAAVLKAPISEGDLIGALRSILQER